MASVSSTYTDPQDTFVWWIEGDRIAIATSKDDGGTTETGKGKYTPSQLSTTTSYQADGSTANLLNEALDASETAVDVDYGAGFTANDIIQVDDEIMRIESISTNTITVTRGFRNTTAATHADDTAITEHDVVTSGVAISYYAEPDKLSSITGTIDLDNVLQPALINYVKAQALMDAAAREQDPNKSMIQAQASQRCLKQYQDIVRKYGMKKNDKTGGLRAVAPYDLR